MDCIPYIYISIVDIGYVLEMPGISVDEFKIDAGNEKEYRLLCFKIRKKSRKLLNSREIVEAEKRTTWFFFS